MNLGAALHHRMFIHTQAKHPRAGLTINTVDSVALLHSYNVAASLTLPRSSSNLLNFGLLLLKNLLHKVSLCHHLLCFTKFRIFLLSRNEEPKGSGTFIEGDGANYNYSSMKRRGFKWDDPKNIKSLHQWHEQIFRRRIGGVRPTRAFWLDSEKRLLLSLLKDMLKTHHCAEWNKLANRFNQTMQRRTQHEGEKLVFKGKKLDRGFMKEDRPAPWRTTSALQGQNLKRKEYHAMIKAKDDEDDRASQEEPGDVSSNDEAEIPDPTPKPTIFAPCKQKPWKKNPNSTTRKNSDQATKTPESS